MLSIPREYDRLYTTDPSQEVVRKQPSGGTRPAKRAIVDVQHVRADTRHSPSNAFDAGRKTRCTSRCPWSMSSTYIAPSGNTYS